MIAMAPITQHLFMKLVLSYLFLWYTLYNGCICNLVDKLEYRVEVYAFRFDRSRNNDYEIKRIELLGIDINS
jgi:hypothetical protein